MAASDDLHLTIRIANDEIDGSADDLYATLAAAHNGVLEIEGFAFDVQVTSLSLKAAR